MEKYYTPEIEEFYKGFIVHIDTDGEWLPTKINYTDELYKLMMTGEDSGVRVKYLDREDIESLGFVKWPDRDVYDLGEFQLHLGRHVEPYKVEIYDDNSQYCFVGVIKNKSELKKVLKMIGYELPLE